MNYANSGVPATIAMVGASGDLTQGKLMQALHTLG
jgi:glucose-6-phosphate 1-dehydrogenase